MRLRVVVPSVVIIILITFSNWQNTKGVNPEGLGVATPIWGRNPRIDADDNDGDYD